MGYVRGSNKDHGRNNKIEGKVEHATKVNSAKVAISVVKIFFIFFLHICIIHYY